MEPGKFWQPFPGVSLLSISDQRQRRLGLVVIIALSCRGLQAEGELSERPRERVAAGDQSG